VLCKDFLAQKRNINKGLKAFIYNWKIFQALGKDCFSDFAYAGLV
jgi:hypothetical protein